MECLTDFTLALDVDDILRGQGADPAVVRKRRPALVETALAALEQGFARIKPVALIHEARVIEHRHEQIMLEGGEKLTGPLVARHLAGAESITAVICTIGAELEAYAASQQDLLLSLALDGLGNAAAELLAQQVCGRLAERARVHGLQTGTPLSPGEPDWPVGIGQPQIFALVDPSNAGIRLTTGGMMIPKKSVSFVVGIGRRMSQAHPCDTCSLKEVCRYTRSRLH